MYFNNFIDKYFAFVSLFPSNLLINYQLNKIFFIGV